MRAAAICIALSMPAQSLSSLADQSVLAFFQKTEKRLEFSRVIYRHPVDQSYEVVIATGLSPATQAKPAVTRGALYLQDRANREAVFLIALVNAIDAEARVRVLRVTDKEIVLGFDGEKFQHFPSQSFSYDIARKKVISRREYERFRVQEIFPEPGGCVFLFNGVDKFDRDVKAQVAVRYNVAAGEFHVLQPKEARNLTPTNTRHVAPNGFFFAPDTRPVPQEAYVITERNGTRTIQYPLPLSTYPEFAKARPNRVANGYDSRSQMNGAIGHADWEGEKLWFGKAFFDGEGLTGVGGFGYFDTITRKYKIYSPPEIVDWSVSAMRLTSDAVWLALDSHGEWGFDGGGVLKFDRESETVTRYEVFDNAVINNFELLGPQVAAGSDFGISIIDQQSGQVRNYFLDIGTDEKPRIVEALR